MSALVYVTIPNYVLEVEALVEKILSDLDLFTFPVEGEAVHVLHRKLLI